MTEEHSSDQFNLLSAEQTEKDDKIKPHVCESNSDLKNKMRQLDQTQPDSQLQQQYQQQIKQDPYKYDHKDCSKVETFLSFDKDCNELNVSNLTNHSLNLTQGDNNRFISPINMHTTHDINKTNGDSTKYIIDELTQESALKHTQHKQKERQHKDLQVDNDIKVKQFVQLLKKIHKTKLVKYFWHINTHACHKSQVSPSKWNKNNPNACSKSLNSRDSKYIDNKSNPTKTVSFGNSKLGRSTAERDSGNFGLKNEESDHNYNTNISNKITTVSKTFKPNKQQTKKLEILMNILQRLKLKVQRKSFEDLFFSLNQSKLLFLGSEGRLSIQNQSLANNSSFVNFVQESDNKQFDRDISGITNSVGRHSLHNSNRNNSFVNSHKRESMNSNDKFKLSNLNYTQMSRSDGAQSLSGHKKGVLSDLVVVNSSESSESKQTNNNNFLDFNATQPLKLNNTFNSAKNTGDKNKNNTLQQSMKQSNSIVDLDESSLYVDQ